MPPAKTMIRKRPDLRHWRRLLAPLSAAYGGVIRLRNRRYDRAGAARHAGIPVISVGNITTGGTGKTPTVIEIVSRLRAMQRRPAILTRGYGAQPGQTADEVLEFEKALPGVAVVVNPDRVAGAAIARRQHDADVLVLDDGFQHRRLARDLDIVLIDALNPWGGAALLPAGNLREPLTGLRRAGLFVISRANQVTPARIDEIETRLRHYGRAPLIIHTTIAATQIEYQDGHTEDAAALAGLRVQPVCGLGNPETFTRLLTPLAACVRSVLPFPDHHRYTRRDADVIARTAQARGSDVVVTTRKDWAKLSAVWPAAPDRPSLVRLDVRVCFPEDSPLDPCLREVLEETA